MKKINLAHITTVDLSLFYLLKNHLLFFKQNGYRVFGISAAGENVSKLTSEGITHIHVRMTRKWFTPFTDLLAIYKLYMILKKEKITIVHTHTPKAGIIGRISAKLAGIPIIIHTNHGFIFSDSKGFKGILFFILEKIAGRCSNAIFSVNREDINFAVRKNIWKVQQVSLLRGGLGRDLEYFDPQKINHEYIDDFKESNKIKIDSKVVGFVGRLVKEKGILDLFDAMRIVWEELPNVELVLIGDLDNSRNDAIDLNITKNIGFSSQCHFLGLKDNMPFYYSLMDIFVLPSYREGLPLSLIEASAMKIPCIATDIRGNRDVIKNNFNGLLVPSGSVDELAKAVIFLIKNEMQAKRYGENGRKFMLEHFNEIDAIESQNEIYKKLLKEVL